ncbi:hypothetical protein SUGI_0665210 [Cryptomeria japonica]|nr:hypothetical protein SUGI_0665210 [Cryptomeria japonica]
MNSEHSFSCEKAATNNTDETAPLVIQKFHTRLAGRLFGPRDENGQWWDDKCMFYPVVLDPSSTGSLWRMYYYGRDQDSWHSEVSPALISSGRIGLAISEDGISWSRYPGPLPGGAIMDPVEANPLCFDCVHIGCSDLFLHNGEWWMFYFGGSLEETIFGPQMRTMKGIKMHVGLAKSSDGISFVRNEVPVLDLGDKGEWDELLVAWARVVPPKLHGSNKWLMTYCSIEKTSSAGCFAIGSAISDNGETWEKRGKVLERGAPGAWDDGGVGRHHVLYVDGQYIMFYEGVNSQGIHAIGVAFSTDGQQWRKSVEPWSQPGGPIFTSTDDKEAWDSGGISCPHVLKFKDEHYLLYYVGTNSSKELSCMGLAISEGLNIRSWKRIGPSVVNKRRPASWTL